jgi:hypothetical protein
VEEGERGDGAGAAASVAALGVAERCAIAPAASIHLRAARRVSLAMAQLPPKVPTMAPAVLFCGAFRILVCM